MFIATLFPVAKLETLPSCPECVMGNHQCSHMTEHRPVIGYDIFTQYRMNVMAASYTGRIYEAFPFPT